MAELTFFERIISGVKGSSEDFFNAATDKLAGKIPEVESFGGKLFQFASLETKQRREEISARAATRFRNTRFGQNFIDDIKLQEFLNFIKNPVVIISGIIITVLLLGMFRR